MPKLIFAITILALAMSSIGVATDRVKGDDLPWSPLLEQLRQSGVENVDGPALANWLKSAPPTADRWAAIEVLGLRGDREAIPVLRTLGMAKDRFIAESAALALARLGEVDGLEMLRGFLESSKDEDRRLFLAARLANLGDPLGYSFVAKAAADPIVERRFLSVAALVAFLPHEAASRGAIDAERRLLALASDESKKVRYEFVIQASLAVERGGNRGRFVAALRSLAAADDDPEVQEMARLMVSGLEGLDVEDQEKVEKH